MPHQIVVMGVSGVGKSTIGSELAAQLGWIFLEGDDFHSFSNVEKMSRGEPLTDSDRQPWLEALGREMSILAHSGRSTVIACSALRESYRETLRQFAPQARFVFLKADRDELALRLRKRPGHFADERILASQLATLEPPMEENAIEVSTDHNPTEIVQGILQQLGLTAPP